MLKALKPGEVVSLPSAGVLSALQQAALVEAADELGYFHDYVKGAEGHILQIGNLKVFEAQCKRQLLMLSVGNNDCDATVYIGGHNDRLGNSNGLSLLERKMVENIAGEYGLHCKALKGSAAEETAEGACAGLTMKVCKRKKGAKTETKEESSDEEDEVIIKETLDQVFCRYSSGKHELLRRSDVHVFLKDACAARGIQANDKLPFVAAVEDVFDDTLELQVDMGSQFHQGLVKEFFQVFMVKAAASFGASLSGFLSSLKCFYKIMDAEMRRRQSHVMSPSSGPDDD
jgi:hypothetical protein